MTDELSAPLGQRPKKTRRLIVPKAVPIGVAALLAVGLLAFAGWTLVMDDPLGGEPIAVVSTTPAPATKLAGSEKATDSQVAVERAGGPAASPGMKTVTIIDGMSGKREQVTIAIGSELAKGPLDARLTDTSRHGPIPKVGADGSRPSEVYAGRQDAAAARSGGARIAIVVGRLGVSANVTADALAKLPAPVTLAFTPYGSDLDRFVSRAHGEGREVLLQVPMEPFDYPDNDPGPQTLLTSLPADQNIDRLHWSMSRFQGYAGIANFMGGRFVTNEPGVTTVLREAATRGLLYFDDGVSARSLTGQIAGANNVPFAKADLVIDAARTPGEIDTALARLEATARERGLAVGSASASALSIDRIAKWAKAAASRGVVLVPLSAIANKPKSS